MKAHSKDEKQMVYLCSSHLYYSISLRKWSKSSKLFRHAGNCYLYGVFDGHNGSRVADFAAQRMPAELLLGQLQNKTTDAEVLEVLRQVGWAKESNT